MKITRNRLAMRVRCILADGRWHSLRSIARRMRMSTVGTSARIRDLRKLPFGGCAIEARPDTRPGPWRYRMVAGSRGRA